MIHFLKGAQSYSYIRRNPTRSDNNTSPNHASGILERLISADSVVPETGIPDPEGFFIPVVTEGFQVPVVVMLTADFQMYDHSFLFSREIIEPLTTTKRLVVSKGNKALTRQEKPESSKNLKAMRDA